MSPTIDMRVLGFFLTLFIVLAGILITGMDRLTSLSDNISDLKLEVVTQKTTNTLTLQNILRDFEELKDYKDVNLIAHGALNTRLNQIEKDIPVYVKDHEIRRHAPPISQP